MSKSAPAVSGAGEKMNYYLSTAYTDNDGIVVGDDFSRATVMGKISTDITDWLKIGADASYARSDYSGVGGGVTQAILLGPYDMMYRDAAHTLLEKYPTGSNEFENPLWGTRSGSRDDLDLKKTFRINTNAVVRLPWVKGLSYRLNYSAYMNADDRGEFYHESYYVPQGPYDDASRYSEATLQTKLGSANRYYQLNRTSSWIIDSGTYALMRNRFGSRRNENPVYYYATSLQEQTPEHTCESAGVRMEGNVFWDLFQEGNQDYQNGNTEAIWVAQMDLALYKQGYGANCLLHSCNYSPVARDVQGELMGNMEDVGGNGVTAVTPHAVSPQACEPDKKQEALAPKSIEALGSDTWLVDMGKVLKRWPDTPYRDWYLGDWLAPAGADVRDVCSTDFYYERFIFKKQLTK